jgi:hypothetical protein
VAAGLFMRSGQLRSCSWRQHCRRGRGCREKAGRARVHGRRHAGEGGAPGGDVSARGRDVQGPAQGRARLLGCDAGETGTGSLAGGGAGGEVQGAQGQGEEDAMAALGREMRCSRWTAWATAALRRDERRRMRGAACARAMALHRKQIASRRSCCGLRVLARPL